MIARYRARVVGGKQLGRTLGFPTANLSPAEGTLLPGNGVYAAFLTLESTGETFPCVLNQGTHPTFPEGAPTVEAFILGGFSRSIYSEEVTIEYRAFLRKEQRFDGAEQLIRQIRADVRRANEILSAKEGPV